MLRLIASIIALLFLPMAALAQGAQVSFGGNQDTNAPVEVTADNLAVNQKEGTAVYSGNVLIVQGDMRLAAQRVVVIYSEAAKKIQRMEATGGVTMVSGEEAAEAQRADYSLDKGVVVMSGDVLLTQGASALTSEKMTVNLETGTAQLSGRVRTVLNQDEAGQ